MGEVESRNHHHSTILPINMGPVNNITQIGWRRLHGSCDRFCMISCYSSGQANVGAT